MRTTSSVQVWMLSCFVLFCYMDNLQGYHSCYECSDKSALCRHSVYDGQYLSRTQCTTPCFLRIEGKRTYRGCFDGWVGGMVDHNYIGCRHQEYFGEKVEWCFCNGEADGVHEPCNAMSHDDLAQDDTWPEELTSKNIIHSLRSSSHDLRPYYDEAYIDNDVNTYDVSSAIITQEHIPTTDREPTKHIAYSDWTRSKPNIERAAKIERLTAQRGKYVTDLDAKPIRDDVPAYVVKPTKQEDLDIKEIEINCFSCHDSMLECGNTVDSLMDHVAQQSCSTKCFIRKERGKLYRGCFDGWQSTRVLSDYVGCRTQIQNGRMSEWCFCDEHLCNEGSMQAMKQLDPYVMPYHVTKRPTVHRHPVVHHYYGERERTNIPSTRRPSKLLQSVLHSDHSAVDTPIIGLCHGQRDGIYPDPYDCHRFIHCYHGFTYRRRCSPGTMWNHRYGNCGHKADVTSDKCELRSEGHPTHRGHESHDPHITDDKLARLVEEVLASDNK